MNVYQVSDAARDLKGIEHTVKLRPNSGNVAHLAATYFTLGETEKALPYARLAWERSKDAGIGMNLSLILKDLGRHRESAEIVEQAFHINPDDPYIRLGYGEALLRAGLWSQAWKFYDGARPTQTGAALDLGLPSSVQEWDGSKLPDDHLLLVINEGGSGDRLNYARWLPELTKMGINWKFYPYSALYSLFERVFPADRLVPDGGEIPDPTHWVTTFSLPAKLMASPGRIPPPLKFTAKPEILAKYKFTRTDNLPIVGLCYRAAEQHQGGRTMRSMSEGQAMRLVCMTGDKVHWVSLQHSEKVPFPVTNIPFDSWEETTALIESLDAVVTVDTSVFWLASCMLKPTFLLLPGNSDWKFLTKGRKCIWSPTVQIFRNPNRGFEEVISQLVGEIRAGQILTPVPLQATS